MDTSLVIWRRRLIPLKFWVLPLSLLVAVPLAFAQGPDPQLCQSQVKIEQDASRYSKEVSAQILTKLEKAEEQIKDLQKKLEEAQKPKE